MSQSDADEMKHASFITSSRYRVATVEQLRDGPSTPSKIAERADVDITNVSRSLNELREMGSVELCVPEGTKRGRIYSLTETAEKAAEIVENL